MFMFYIISSVFVRRARSSSNPEPSGTKKLPLNDISSNLRNHKKAYIPRTTPRPPDLAASFIMLESYILGMEESYVKIFISC